jgi:hypothetical protein
MRYSRMLLVVVLAGLLLGVSPRIGSTSTISIELAPQFSLVAAGVSLQQQGCFKAIPCLGAGCVPVPTSLPAVNINIAGDYQSVGRNCGAKRCFLIFTCACGPPLASGFCI